MNRREAILYRLEQLLPTVPGVVSFFRNEVKAPEGKLPAVLLLDGDEVADETAFGRGRPANAITRITMMPEVYVIVMDGALVGPLLNSMRARIKYAILNDTELLELCKDGDIRYEGLQTALALGRSMAGEMGMNFSMVYVDRNETGVETHELGAEFEGEGDLNVHQATTRYLKIDVAGGGELGANVEMAPMGADFGGGGTLSVYIATLPSSGFGVRFRGEGFLGTKMVVSHQPQADFEGGGQLRGNIFPPVTMQARFGGGGSFEANAQVRRYLSAVIEGGGQFTSDVSAPPFGASFMGGGSFDADIVPVFGVGFGGGGELGADIAEPPEEDIGFIGASNIQYGTSGFNITTHPDTQAGDILVLVQVSGGNDPSLIGGWTNVGTVTTVGAESSGTGVKTSRKLATGPSEVIAIPDSGAHNAAVCLTFRGYDPSLVSFRSSATGAANGTSIGATGSEANNLTDQHMFVYAGRNAILSPSVSSANWLDETVVTSINNSISLFVAVAKPAVTTSIPFLIGTWTNNMANRVATAIRLRP